MDPLKRQQLKERRAGLLDEIKLRERRARVQDRTDILDAHGVAHNLLYDDRAQVDWICQHFPRGGGLLSARIDWARVPECEMGPEAQADDGEAAVWLGELAARKELQGDVVLLTGNGLDPAICVEFQALLSLPQVVTCGMDLWVVSESDGWVIEFLRFEHGWWWGRASGVAMPGYGSGR